MMDSCLTCNSSCHFLNLTYNSSTRPPKNGTLTSQGFKRGNLTFVPYQFCLMILAWETPVKISVNQQECFFERIQVWNFRSNAECVQLNPCGYKMHSWSKIEQWNNIFMHCASQSKRYLYPESVHKRVTSNGQCLRIHSFVSFAMERNLIRGLL